MAESLHWPNFLADVRRIARENLASYIR